MEPTQSPTQTPTPPRPSVRDGIARLLGVDVAARERLVATMIDRHERDAASYWLQLVLATGIATLGLVLDSTGVVIGAMLVSPLMAPILELGMAFATGSPFLVIRSSLRFGLSVVVVVGGAAILTVMLPFREMTGEIAARTGPTVLDLVVAVFCALAAAFTTARATSDTTAAAAGTAISIALVPPLCVVGFGVGTGDADTAGGSALLFTANFCAILLFSTVFFLLTGFDVVHGWTLEAGAPAARSRSASRAAGRLRAMLGSRYGVWLRVLMPVLLVAVVYVPLRSALERLTWQVRVGGEVRRIIGEVVPTQRIVQSGVVVERGAVSIRLVLVSTPETAARLETQLRTRVAAAAATVPDVSVVAVTDAQAVRAETDALRRRMVPPPLRLPPPAAADVAEAIGRLGTELTRAWPGGSVGPLAQWSARTDGNGISVTVEHVGEPLGGAAVTLLGQRLGERLSTRASVIDRAFSPAEHVAPDGSLDTWLTRLGELAAAAEHLPASHLCVRAPPAALSTAADPSATRRGRRLPPPQPDPRAQIRSFVVARATAAAGSRATVTESDVLSVRLSATPCESTAAVLDTALAPPEPAPSEPSRDAGQDGG